MPVQSYILYAEDDADDQAIFKECMRRIDPSMPVLCFLNGELLFRFLENMEKGELLPSCVILDMNMPVWSGMETLKQLKQHPIYQKLPVFVFSTSSTESEKTQAEALGAEAYITKPYAQIELFKVCQEFAEYAGRSPRLKGLLHTL